MGSTVRVSFWSFSILFAYLQDEWLSWKILARQRVILKDLARFCQNLARSRKITIRCRLGHDQPWSEPTIDEMFLELMEKTLFFSKQKVNTNYLVFIANIFSGRFCIAVNSVFVILDQSGFKQPQSFDCTVFLSISSRFSHYTVLTIFKIKY